MKAEQRSRILDIKAQLTIISHELHEMFESTEPNETGRKNLGAGRDSVDDAMEYLRDAALGR